MAGCPPQESLTKVYERMQKIVPSLTDTMIRERLESRIMRQTSMYNNASITSERNLWAYRIEESRSVLRRFSQKAA